MSQKEVDEMVSLLNRENKGLQSSLSSIYAPPVPLEEAYEEEDETEEDENDAPVRNRTVGDWISSPFAKLALAGVGVAGLMGFIAMMIIPSETAKKPSPSVSPSPLTPPTPIAKDETPDYKAALAVQTQAKARARKESDSKPLPRLPVKKTELPVPRPEPVRASIPAPIPAPVASIPAPAPMPVVNISRSIPQVPERPIETPDQEWNRLSAQGTYGQVPPETSATLVSDNTPASDATGSDTASNPIDSQTDSNTDIVQPNRQSANVDRNIASASTDVVNSGVKELSQKRTEGVSAASSLPLLSYAQTPGGAKKVLIGSQINAEVVSTVAIPQNISNIASPQSESPKVLLKLRDDLKAVDGSVVIPQGSTIVAAMLGADPSLGGVRLQATEVVIGSDEFALPPGIEIRGDGNPMLPVQRLNQPRSQSSNRLVPSILGGIANAAASRIDSTGIAGNVVSNVINPSGLSNGYSNGFENSPWVIKAGQKAQIYANQTLIF